MMSTLFFSMLVFFLAVFSSSIQAAPSNHQQLAGALSPMYVARWPAPVWGMQQPRQQQQPYRMLNVEDLVGVSQQQNKDCRRSGLDLSHPLDSTNLQQLNFCVCIPTTTNY
uniref:Uncharacterized protein n=1 Tax=Ditylenchus dipsaci TaxID=166011 RepID=A0A915D3Q0_9BILA